MIRILIADDHEIVRYGLRKILERQPGWEVVAEASNGKDAITKAVESKPDVAVLDYAMPVINGAEATRQIRARLPNTEVLIFSAFDDHDLIQESLRAGARSYLMKGDTENHLVSAIEFLAVRKPFFTGKVAETLLRAFMATPHGAPQMLLPGHNLPALATQQAHSVLQLLAEGHTEKHIAKHLNINLRLVKALVSYATRNGLVER